MTPVSGPGLPRRDFLGALGLAGLAVGLGSCASDGDRTGDGEDRDGPDRTGSAPDGTTTALPVDLPSDPFTLGVASGDPTSDAVVLWTRLHPSGGGQLPAAVPLRWSVASDEAFGEIVLDGEATATAELGHSIHVDASGLASGSTYWYRFTAGEWTSPIGRTRTSAAPDGSTAGVRFGVANCQAYQSGYFTAYRDIAGADLDAVLFLGDFIYELESSVEVRPHGLEPATTLEEYRRFYEVNGADPDLQAARQAHPWVVTWDDHEVEDNYAGLEPGQLGEETSQRIEGGFPARRAAAYQAWWEHQPVRGGPPQDGVLPIHRDLDFGDLVTLAVLDVRQHRTPEAETDGAGALPRAFGGGPQPPGAFDPDATMLGAEQEAWLGDVLARAATPWVLVAQQSAISQIDRRPDLSGGGFSVDSWDGYVVPRARLLGSIDDDLVGRVVFVGGDLHTSVVADVHADPTDPTSPVVAPELIGPSISALELLAPEALAGARANPHIQMYDIEQRGWLLLDITSQQLDATFRYVDATLPDAESVDGSRWRITAGDPRARPIEEN